MVHLVFLKTWSECILHFPFRHFKGSDCINCINDILQIDFFLKDWTTPMSSFPPLALWPQVYIKHILSLETRQTHNFLHDFTKRCIQQSVSSLFNIIPNVKILHFSGSLLPLLCLSCMVRDCVENEYLHSINMSVIFYWICFPLSYHILRCAFFSGIWQSMQNVFPKLFKNIYCTLNWWLVQIFKCHQLNVSYIIDIF